MVFKAKKAAFVLAFINQRFSNARQRVADPIVAIQHIVSEERASEIKKGSLPIKRNEIGKAPLKGKEGIFTPYDEELMKIERWEGEE